MPQERESSLRCADFCVESSRRCRARVPVGNLTRDTAARYLRPFGDSLMTPLDRLRSSSRFALIAISLFGVARAVAQTPAAQYPALPSETPAQLQVPAGALDYTKRDVMIPMRDGIKLHTVILIPKGAQH